MATKRLNTGQKHVITLSQHPLATQEFLELLKSIGSPETSAETKILSCLVADYDDMGTDFPSFELKADLAALYSNALGVKGAIQAAVAALVNKHSSLAIEAKGLCPGTLTWAKQQKFAAEWSKTFKQIDTEATPILVRCRELLFLTLKAASERIRAALKTAAQE